MQFANDDTIILSENSQQHEIDVYTWPTNKRKEVQCRSHTSAFAGILLKSSSKNNNYTVQCSRITFSTVHRNTTAAINRPGNFAQFNRFESIQEFLQQTFLAVSSHWGIHCENDLIKTTIMPVPSGWKIRLAKHWFDKNST